MLSEHPLNVLPLQPINRHRVLGHQRFRVGLLGQQRGQYIVGISRFAQVVAGATLDGFYRRGNTGVAGQNHDAQVRVELQQAWHQYQTRIPFHLQIEHGVVRTLGAGNLHRLLCSTGCIHLQATPAKGARHHAGKGRVIVHQQHTGLLFLIQLVGHQRSPAATGNCTSVRVPPPS